MDKSHINTKKKLFQNKKGLSGPELIGTFILIFLIVGGVIAYNRGAFGGAKTVLGCQNNGGECRDSGCDLIKEYILSGDKAAGCEKGEICCISYDKPKPADKRCVGVEEGKNCKGVTDLICSPSVQCVSKCEYCRHNFRTAIGREICKPDTNLIFANASKYQLELSCSCTTEECNTKGSSGCITTFCPKGDSTLAECCIK